MRPEKIMLAGHVAALGFAFATALLCPRPGEAALLLPLHGAGPDAALAWAAREEARFLALDTASGRVVALVPDHGSLLRALAAGIIPIAADGTGCAGVKDGETSWKN
ncbi:hypothetical protein [Erythrobacter sp.]|uniref:hypothetical protein n=1 Tax=Erythrobacter sp. TaxID=1042 RepID=UPI001425C6F5|nr:hypothetical protein [Erythrobacter sp.]QIQ86614.1 MAG: hypothetical protein G9473_07895 [Erythrobacter sp.]